MEDNAIVDLYWSRSEDAIEETDKKYGAYCRQVSYNILRNPQDADECVNDTYLGAWNAMPPHRPKRLSSFLGTITRNIALDRYRYNHAQKRSAGVDVMFSELEGCIPANCRAEEAFELHTVTDVINRFLAGLSSEKRIIFVQRYWYAQPLREIADSLGMSEGQVKSILFRLRAALKTALEKEGVTV